MKLVDATRIGKDLPISEIVHIIGETNKLTSLKRGYALISPDASFTLPSSNQLFGHHRPFPLIKHSVPVLRHCPGDE
jgi:hypothetical protein